MPATTIKPSSRLLRAAAAERTDIARQRERLHTRYTALAAQLQEIEASLATLDEHEALLGQLASVSEQANGPNAQLATNRTIESKVTDPATAEALGEAIDDSAHVVLRGPAIRQAAVSLLIARGHTKALHYRAWYELLASEGYRVAGKDPLAVFLTQLGRSPVVRKSTQAGVYELDSDAPRRLTKQLATFRAELLQAAGGSLADGLSESRNRREKLLNDIRHTERALDEAERMLGPAVVEAADLRAVS